MDQLIELEHRRLAWSLKTFCQATPMSSLYKLLSEMVEIEADILAGKRDAIEYADALMCLLDSAGRQGIMIEDIIEAYRAKLVINQSREWKKNADNSYSHIKKVKHA